MKIKSKSRMKRKIVKTVGRKIEGYGKDEGGREMVKQEQEKDTATG